MYQTLHDGDRPKRILLLLLFLVGFFFSGGTPRESSEAPRTGSWMFPAYERPALSPRHAVIVWSRTPMSGPQAVRVGQVTYVNVVDGLDDALVVAVLLGACLVVWRRKPALLLGLELLCFALAGLRFLLQFQIPWAEAIGSTIMAGVSVSVALALTPELLCRVRSLEASKA